MERVADGLVRVIVLLTPEQAKTLDEAARAGSLSRSSYMRTQLTRIIGAKGKKVATSEEGQAA